MNYQMTTENDPETPYRRLAYAVLAKAISDYLIIPDRKERRIIAQQAERFLFPPDEAWRNSLRLWTNLAGIDFAWFTNTFLPELAENRKNLVFSATTF